MADFLSTIFVLFIVIFVYKWYRSRQTIDNIEGRYVFITGCDTGFGFLLTKGLDELGFKVFSGCLTEKGRELLKKETSNNVTPVQLDVTKQSSIDSAFEFVKSQILGGRGLWGLVNNAGIAGAVAPVDWLIRKDYDECLAVNLFGMVDVTRTFMPLIRNYKGRIINMTSIAGRVAFLQATYVVSKYGAEGYSDVLRRNLYKSGVTVHIVEPGFFDTNISTLEGPLNSLRQHFDQLPQEDKDFYGQEYVDQMEDMIRNGVVRFTSPKTEKVINAYVHALTAKYPKAGYVVGFDANTFFRLMWTVPEWLSDLILTRDTPMPKDAM